MKEATDWDLWNAGLIGGPEPRGRRRPAELAAMRAEHVRNFALACLNLNERWEAQHGTSKPRPEPPSMRAYRNCKFSNSLTAGSPGGRPRNVFSKKECRAWQ